MNQLKKLSLHLPVGKSFLPGDLTIPDDTKGLVIFSHGSGSSRLSQRNKYVAELLNQRGIATLLFDLLTEEEDRNYENRFNIELLKNRLFSVTKYLKTNPDLKELPFGYFGASTGAASALLAAALLPTEIQAVVSRGGRPDLAMENIHKVKCPTLLIVGELDTDVILLNRQAYQNMNCVKKIEIVEGATHLFEEPGTLKQAAQLAADWFEKHLVRKQVNV